MILRFRADTPGVSAQRLKIILGKRQRGVARARLSQADGSSRPVRVCA